MDLEALRKRVGGTEAVTLPGDQTVYLKRLSAADGLALQAKLAQMGYGADGGPDDTPERLVELYSFLLSKLIVNHKSEKTLDSDEGRKLLAQLNIADLTKLGVKALRMVGLNVESDEPAKKNSPPTNDSPDNSPATSDDPTSTDS